MSIWDIIDFGVHSSSP